MKKRFELKEKTTHTYRDGASSAYSARFEISDEHCSIEDFDGRGRSMGYPRSMSLADGRKEWAYYTGELNYERAN